MEEEVYETGARDLDFRDRGVRRQGGFHRLGNLARVLTRGLRETHGNVRGEIAVRCVSGALHLDVDVALCGGNEGFGQRGQRLPQQGLDQVLQGKSVDRSVDEGAGSVPQTPRALGP